MAWKHQEVRVFRHVKTAVLLAAAGMEKRAKEVQQPSPSHDISTSTTTHTTTAYSVHNPDGGGDRGGDGHVVWQWWLLTAANTPRHIVPLYLVLSPRKQKHHILFAAVERRAKEVRHSSASYDVTTSTTTITTPTLHSMHTAYLGGWRGDGGEVYSVCCSH